MPITTIKTIPAQEMYQLHKNQASKVIFDLINQHDNLSIVSILDPTVPSIFHKDGIWETGWILRGRSEPLRVPVVQTKYHDVVVPHGSEHKFQDYILMKESDADRIVRLILESHNKPGDTFLLVNCMAGISRSGAVATFANFACDADFTKLIQLNPQIRPNAHNLRMLFKMFEKITA